MANTDFSIKTRKSVAAQLHILLANEYVLYTKTQKFHWNVTGKWFGSLHLLFEKHYQELADIIDGVAERSLMLGIKTIATLEEFLKVTTLTEEPGKNPTDTRMIEILVLDHETIIETLREDITVTAELGDMGTNNFLCDLLEKHEKMAWMLKAHLEK
jgi:starvation-inducible DNA-binding protein